MFYFVLLLISWFRGSPSKETVFKTTAGKISFMYKPGGQPLNEAAGKNTKFAMNGEMYHEDYSPVGLYIENRKLIHKATIVNNNSINFGINPEAVFYIDTNNKAGMEPSYRGCVGNCAGERYHCV